MLRYSSQYDENIKHENVKNDSKSAGNFLLHARNSDQSREGGRQRLHWWQGLIYPLTGWGIFGLVGGFAGDYGCHPGN